MFNVRARIRNWRRRYRWTQAKMARALGVSLRTVKAVELGEVKVSYKTERLFREFLIRHEQEKSYGYRRTKTAPVRWTGD